MAGGSKPLFQQGTRSEGFAYHALPYIRVPSVSVLSGPKVLRQARSATDAGIPIHTLLVVVSIKLSTVHVDGSKPPQLKGA